MIEGNKKKINVVNPLNKLDNPIGEFTTTEEPVVTVMESKIPAEAAAIKTDNSKKIPT
jgi:hypothetical protein